VKKRVGVDFVARDTPVMEAPPVSTFHSMPAWLGTAATGAIIAALGYVARLFVETWREYRQTKNLRFAALVKLHSLLQVSRVSFEIQNEHAIRLVEQITNRCPQLAREGYEDTLAAAFGEMNPEERELHAIVRCISVNSLKPTNDNLLEWLQSDTYFKAQYSKKGLPGICALKLSHLEAHLLLWRSKYEVWIPNHPEHALVYLVDEKAHGLGFPENLDKTVEQMVRTRAVSGG